MREKMRQEGEIEGKQERKRVRRRDGDWKETEAEQGERDGDQVRELETKGGREWVLGEKWSSGIETQKRLRHVYMYILYTV